MLPPTVDLVQGPDQDLSMYLTADLYQAPEPDLDLVQDPGLDIDIDLDLASVQDQGNNNGANTVISLPPAIDLEQDLDQDLLSCT